MKRLTYIGIIMAMGILVCAANLLAGPDDYLDAEGSSYRHEISSEAVSKAVEEKSEQLPAEIVKELTAAAPTAQAAILGEQAKPAVVAIAAPIIKESKIINRPIIAIADDTFLITEREIITKNPDRNDLKIAPTVVAANSSVSTPVSTPTTPTTPSTPPPADPPPTPPSGGGSGGSGGSGGGGCFLSGTPILMANGLTKPIQEVKVGDKILAFDEKTKGLKEDSVKLFFQHDAKEYLIINDNLKVTSNHPVYSEGKWVEIGKLSVGSNLLNAKGQAEEITSIRLVREPVKVYNLEVNPYHTYIAGGIVAHNKTPNRISEE